MLGKSFIFISVLSLVLANKVRVDKFWFQACPNVDGPVAIVRKDEVKGERVENAAHMLKYGSSHVQDFELVDEDGSVHELSLPGCYNLRLKLKFNVTITQPYVEVYMDVNNGLLKPCDDFKKENKYCRNSNNFMLGVTTQNMKTCRFCDVCMKKDKVIKEAQKYDKNFKIQQTKQLCETVGSIQADETYSADIGPICLPSKEEIEKKMGEKVKHWNLVKNTIYGRHGTIMSILHILDRENPISKTCLKLGIDDVLNVPGPLKNFCATKVASNAPEDIPVDTYIGCYMAVLNFSTVNQDQV